jgi:hypothetical protein
VYPARVGDFYVRPIHLAKAPIDANEQQHAELVEACKRLYPNLTDEEIEEFLRAHGARSPHQIDSDRGFSAGLRVGELPAKSIQLQRAQNGRVRPATIDMRRFITESGELRIRSQPPDDLSLAVP